MATLQFFLIVTTVSFGYSYLLQVMSKALFLGVVDCFYPVATSNLQDQRPTSPPSQGLHLACVFLQSKTLRRQKYRNASERQIARHIWHSVAMKSWSFPTRFVAIRTGGGRDKLSVLRSDRHNLHCSANSVSFADMA